MADRLKGRQVAVIGAFHCEGNHYQKAYEVGTRLAKEGATLVCGGLSGVMEAASKGAHEAGGLTVGILPTYDKADANPYCGVVIATGMGHARNVSVVASADAVVALSGSYGTLSEIALALRLGKPVVGIDTWKLTDPRDGETAPIKSFQDVGEAIEQVLLELGV